MAAFSITCKCFSPNPTHHSFQTSHNPLLFLRYPAVRFPDEIDRRRIRGLSVVTRAGPSSNQLIFAFVFPLSLIAITAFTAFRIGDKLDQKFLQELAMNEAMREAEEEDDEDNVGEVGMPRKEEAALPRRRNRPKREV